MPNDLDLPDDRDMRQRALSRWDNEGGASPTGPAMAPTIADARIAMPIIDDAGSGALHVRVIALESLVIALLAYASERELETARAMAAILSPRPDATAHPLTIRAADHIGDLIRRAGCLSTREQGPTR